MSGSISPAFPNVPLTAGVPPVGILLGAIRNPQILLTTDAAASLSSLFYPQWGIFSPFGLPVVTGDSVLQVEFRKDWKISDFPIEAGGFESYNKVETPFDIRIAFSVGGSLENRRTFLELVKAVCSTTAVYSVVTPEAVYLNANACHYDYARQVRSGQQLIVVEIFLNEVRVVASSTFTDTKQPDGADPTVTGSVQPDTSTSIPPLDAGAGASAAPVAATLPPSIAAPSLPPPGGPATASGSSSAAFYPGNIAT